MWYTAGKGQCHDISDLSTDAEPIDPSGTSGEVHIPLETMGSRLSRKSSRPAVETEVGDANGEGSGHFVTLVDSEKDVSGEDKDSLVSNPDEIERKIQKKLDLIDETGTTTCGVPKNWGSKSKADHMPSSCSPLPVPSDTLASPSGSSPENKDSGRNHTSLPTSRSSSLDDVELNAADYADMPEDIKLEEADVLLMTSDQEETEGNHLKDLLEEIEYHTDQKRTTTRKCSVYLLADVLNQSKVDSLPIVQDKCTMVFILISKSFCNDAWAKFQKNEMLVRCITSGGNWTVVPLFTQPKGTGGDPKKAYQIPPGLVSFRGLDLSRLLDNGKKSVLDLENLENGDRFLKRNIVGMLERTADKRVKREEVNKEKREKWELMRKNEKRKEKLINENEKHRIKAKADDDYQKTVEEIHRNPHVDSNVSSMPEAYPPPPPHQAYPYTSMPFNSQVPPGFPQMYAPGPHQPTNNYPQHHPQFQQQYYSRYNPHYSNPHPAYVSQPGQVPVGPMSGFPSYPYHYNPHPVPYPPHAMQPPPPPVTNYIFTNTSGVQIGNSNTMDSGIANLGSMVGDEDEIARRYCNPNDSPPNSIPNSSTDPPEPQNPQPTGPNVPDTVTSPSVHRQPRDSPSTMLPPDLPTVKSVFKPGQLPKKPDEYPVTDTTGAEEYSWPESLPPSVHPSKPINKSVEDSKFDVGNYLERESALARRIPDAKNVTEDLPRAFASPLQTSPSPIPDLKGNIPPRDGAIPDIKKLTLENQLPHVSPDPTNLSYLGIKVRDYHQNDTTLPAEWQQNAPNNNDHLNESSWSSQTVEKVPFSSADSVTPSELEDEIKKISGERKES